MSEKLNELYWTLQASKRRFSLLICITYCPDFLDNISKQIIKSGGVSFDSKDYDFSYKVVTREQLMALYKCPVVIAVNPDKYGELIHSNPHLFQIRKTFDFTAEE